MTNEHNWKEGDIGWRGYARHYENEKEWWPEIRPAHVKSVNKDGTLEVIMEGIMPGHETRRNPGRWIAWNLSPELLYRTPEEALEKAKLTVEQQIKERHR